MYSTSVHVCEWDVKLQHYKTTLSFEFVFSHASQTHLEKLIVHRGDCVLLPSFHQMQCRHSVANVYTLIVNKMEEWQIFLNFSLLSDHSHFVAIKAIFLGDIKSSKIGTNLQLLIPSSFKYKILSKQMSVSNGPCRRTCKAWEEIIRHEMSGSVKEVACENIAVK